MGIAAKALRLFTVPGADRAGVAIAARAAQSDRGRITGRVSDPQNAVVAAPGSCQRCRDRDRAPDDHDGDRRLHAHLSSGAALRPDHRGGRFQDLRAAGVRVQVAQATRVDATLDSAPPPRP